MSDMCTDNHMTSYSSFSETEICMEMDGKTTIKKAMMLCVSCRDWSFPKNILIETDGNGSERLNDIVNRAFEKYKKTQNIDDLRLIDYTYYGDVEICR